MLAYDKHWADLFYYIGDGKPSEYAALNRMPTLEFYRLLESHRRNHKPE